MRLMIIDADWLDDIINTNHDIIKQYGDNQSAEDMIEAYEVVREHLQSPKELIKNAFEAGEEYGTSVTLFNNTNQISRFAMESTPDLGQYLKDINIR